MRLIEKVEKVWNFLFLPTIMAQSIMLIAKISYLICGKGLAWSWWVILLPLLWWIASVIFIIARHIWLLFNPQYRK